MTDGDGGKMLLLMCVCGCVCVCLAVQSARETKASPVKVTQSPIRHISRLLATRETATTSFQSMEKDATRKDGYQW